MDIWFSSDFHMGHRNIITYCSRPFRDVGHMNEELISRHNAVVKPEDLVIDVGDFSMSHKGVEGWRRRLHGRRKLIYGNHDRCHHMHSAHEKWVAQYVAWGFEEVLPNLGMTIADRDVRIEHMPYNEDVERHKKYDQYRPKDDGRFLIHGHIHAKPTQRIRGRMIDVGVDANGYAPVHIDQLAQWISEIDRSAAKSR